MLKNIGDYKQYIYQNLTWPKEAIKKNIEGTVAVEFTIDTKGNLKDLVISSNQEVLKKEVERLFINMNEWYPAVSHNRLVEWKEKIEIPFYFNRSMIREEVYEEQNE